METEARAAALDMRERAAEKAETKARELREHAKSYPNSHYGRGLGETADEMDRLAATIRSIPIVSKQDREA